MTDVHNIHVSARGDRFLLIIDGHTFAITRWMLASIVADGVKLLVAGGKK